jgi:hypothetical protein
MHPDYTDILTTVIENARVLAHDDGTFITASLIEEVTFEARERGLTRDDVLSAVEFALVHATNH